MVSELIILNLTYYLETLLSQISCAIESGPVVFLLELVETKNFMSRYQRWI
jgi:hypothetical protein